jgi:hypothetical protein
MSEIMIEDTKMLAPQIKEKPSFKDMIVHAAADVVATVKENGRMAAMVLTLAAASHLTGCAAQRGPDQMHPVQQMAQDAYKAEVKVFFNAEDALNAAKQIHPKTGTTQVIYTEVDYNKPGVSVFDKDTPEPLPSVFLVSNKNLGKKIDDNELKRVDAVTTSTETKTFWDYARNGDPNKSVGDRIFTALKSLNPELLSENTVVTKRDTKEFNKFETLYRTSPRQIENALARSSTSSKMTQANNGVIDQDIATIEQAATNSKMDRSVSTLEYKNELAQRVFETMGEDRFKETYDKFYDARGNTKPALKAESATELGKVFIDLKNELNEIRSDIRSRDNQQQNDIESNTNSFLNKLEGKGALNPGAKTEHTDIQPDANKAKDAGLKFMEGRKNNQTSADNIDFIKPEGMTYNITELTASIDIGKSLSRSA